MDESETVTIFQSSNEFEAQQAVSLLEASGIPCVMQRDTFTDLFGFRGLTAGSNPTTGRHKVLVRSEYQQEAADLLSAYLENDERGDASRDDSIEGSVEEDDEAPGEAALDQEPASDEEVWRGVGALVLRLLRVALVAAAIVLGLAYLLGLFS
jgi:hypothetical protein